MNTLFNGCVVRTGAALVVALSAGSAFGQYKWRSTIRLDELHLRAKGANVWIGQIEPGTTRRNHAALKNPDGSSKVEFHRTNDATTVNNFYATHVAGLGALIAADATNTGKYKASR